MLPFIMVVCHRKCFWYTCVGIFLTLACLGVVSYFSHCEVLYGEKDTACTRQNIVMCEICTSCVCANTTNHCPPSMLSGYCGEDCREASDKVVDMGCPGEETTVGMIALFSVLIIVFGVPTVYYFAKEACQTLTGTQDDV